MATPIPKIYQTLFTTVDPLLSTSGILTTLFAPTTFLKSYFPHPTLTPETTLTLRLTSAFFASTLLLQLYLRSRPTDLSLWKAVQAAILVQDLVFLAAFGVLVAERGGGKWTVNEIGNTVILGAAAVVRGAFLAGVGVGKGGKGR